MELSRRYWRHRGGVRGRLRRDAYVDRLREDEPTRAAYLAVKQQLAERFRDDRGAYSRGKSDFIDAVVRAAGGPERTPWNK